VIHSERSFDHKFLNKFQFESLDTIEINDDEREEWTILSEKLDPPREGHMTLYLPRHFCG
jgi:hypothetical protein